MRERALKTRSIDKLQTAKPAQLRQCHADQVDLLGVLRIFLLGDIAADLVERNFGIMAIPVMNPRLFAGFVADFGDRGRNRYDPDCCRP